MPMSTRTRLAHAKRVLKRLEADEQLMHVRISGYSQPQRELALKMFADMLEKQRAYVEQLEAESRTGNCH